MSDHFTERLTEALCRSFAVHPDGEGRWVVQTPVVHDDGDGFPIFVVADGPSWALTDDGMTASHLFFDDFEATEARVGRLVKVAELAGVEVSETKRLTLRLDAPPTPFDIGDFIQVIAQVQGAARATNEERDNLRYRRRIRDAVVSRLRVPDYETDWSPRELARSGKKATYKADLRIGTGDPARPDVVLFAAGTSDRANVAALSVHQFRRTHGDFQPLLAFYPGRVSSQAIWRFQDEVEDEHAVVQVAPDDTMTLAGALRERGVLVGSAGDDWTLGA